jgi:hypothetical protein
MDRFHVISDNPRMPFSNRRGVATFVAKDNPIPFGLSAIRELLVLGPHSRSGGLIELMSQLSLYDCYYNS